ncbi:Uncharacterised protein (plasmid) [Tsukamurella tyrosinosolvens]|uniref:Uncharacterized protein n=1 Tax=Tsukamurella tyrosinosolvens TaxID=57704 RepID=A0A1H4I6N7_TSUTY|nr:hypothetical protein SAMN04489793_0035 [Tsukamurella tyrosinosolvens]VEH95869.1 Uncharacterised protein [Tsukamurella tyrosinosolvens]
MNQKKVASTIATVGVLVSSVVGCGGNTTPLTERVFTDVICMKVYTSGGSGANCSDVLKSSTSELESCVPQKPSSPISSLSELARYCPSVAVRITASTASTAPSSTQGTDTENGAGNATEAAPATENMSGFGDTVNAMVFGILGLLAVTAFGFWYRARRDRQNRTAQRAHAAEHGWHN